jgi:putative hydrolase of the HAD superfamily
MSKNGLIVFDLDDTLLNTSNVYWLARKLFIEKLSEELQIDRSQLIEEFEKIDHLQMQKLKHSPHRYTRSMIETYKSVSNKINHQISEQTLKEITNFGRLILKCTPETIQGAKEILDWASNNYFLALLTRGENSFQKKKLHKNELYKYFDFIRVVPQKNSEVLEKFIKDLGFDCKKTWVIGDSLKSDINPGIAIGTNCILYEYKHPDYHWIQDHENVALGSFYRVSKLSDIKAILESASNSDQSVITSNGLI